MQMHVSALGCIYQHVSESLFWRPRFFRQAAILSATVQGQHVGVSVAQCCGVGLTTTMVARLSWVRSSQWEDPQSGSFSRGPAPVLRLYTPGSHTTIASTLHPERRSNYSSSCHDCCRVSTQSNSAEEDLDSAEEHHEQLCLNHTHDLEGCFNTFGLPSRRLLLVFLTYSNASFTFTDRCKPRPLRAAW